MLQTALPPGSIIGVIGGGQLGRMLALAAGQLALKVHIYCPDDDAPAFDVAAFRTCAPFDDIDALAKFAEQCDAVTFEFENIPLSALAVIADHAKLAPGIKSLEKTQDRLIEKTLLRDLGIAVAPFASVDDLETLTKAIDAIGTPAILKTRRFGYDGKGQVKINADIDASAARATIQNAPAILEGFVPFDGEFSVVMTRGCDGEMVFYDLAENTHDNHILKETKVPATTSAEVRMLATNWARDIAHALDHVGTLAVEFFYMGEAADTPLLVNEIAPRVHNSGHWTQDACLVSQFENHMRAVASWPLGPTTRHSDAVMTNLIGEEFGIWKNLAASEGALHLYGKTQARPGRKMGHVTQIRPKSVHS